MSHQILILNTGGTLSAVVQEHGLSPGILTKQMERELQIVAGGAQLTLEDYSSLDSANMFPENWADLAAVIAKRRACYDGIVVIHGTDTLAYTASMLSFMLQNIGIPVVLTGSQLSIADPIADAMENCRCAICMAASGVPGVFVAFDRKVMLGCRASKLRTVSFDAFESINYPYVARISSLGMRIDKATLPAKTGIFQLRNQWSSDIAVIRLYPGFNGAMLERLADDGCRAFYIEGFGLGGVPFLQHDLTAVLRKLTDRGVPVLLGTQCRYEGSNLSIYETGRRALDAGVMQAWDMTGEAAITKLMWVLGQTEDPAEIRDYFSLNMCGEVCVVGDGSF